MGKLKKDHVAASGGAAVTAGAIGAAIGALVAGPPGSVVGAAAGAALGAVGGQKVSEALDTSGDLGHFEQIYQTMTYYVDGMAWRDYAPAYQYGIACCDEPDASSRRFEEDDWSRVRDGSRLTWEQALPAVEHAWRDVDQTRRNPDAAA